MRMIKILTLLLFISILISSIETPFALATNETRNNKDLGTLGRKQQISPNLVSKFDAIKVDHYASNSHKMIDHQIETSSSIFMPDGYPLIEEFNVPEIFTSTDPDVYIADGKVNWTIYRDEGEKYVYRSIPSFSGDVRLVVSGQIDSATNNCGVKVGIGNVLDSGIEVIFGFAGGGCATNGYLIDARGVSLNHSLIDCNFVGDWLWVDSGTQYTATLTIQDDSVDLSVPSVGSVTGTPVFTNTYESLYIGNTGDGDLPSCTGTIESVVIEPITFCDSISELPTSECEALLTLYSNTDGDNWLDNTSWLETYTPCSSPWYGVICSEGHVTQLDLSGNQLNGSIPAELGNLTSLQYLSLANNHLSGTIPIELGGLASLTRLNLNLNQLSGSIPIEFGGLANLDSLFMISNQLDGSIPTELGDLDNLISLRLSNNLLDGSIPVGVGNMEKLEFLDLASNQLTGSIPSQLGDLSMLLQLDLASNQLSGNIPVELGLLTILESLSLEDNQLEGSIPMTVGSLSSLNYLYLSKNKLGGSLPVELGGLANLEELDVAFNQLSGEIPAAIVSLSGLSFADLGYNMLSATNPELLTYLAEKDPDWAVTQTVPPLDVAIVNVASSSVELTWTPIAYTDDGGTYEISFATTSGGPYTVHETTANKTTSSYLVNGLSAETKYYYVVRTYTPIHDDQQNELWSSYGDEVSSTTLPTSDCDNVYEIPTIECQALLALYNANNGDNWTINTGWLVTDTPCSTPWYGVVCDEGHVIQISLVNNQLTGTIPQEVGNLSSLLYLYLYGNQLSGNIPSQIGNLNNLRYLYLYSNQLDGGIPPEFGNLSNLQYLSLSSNQLSGSIPMELGNLSSLHNLYLYSNQLNGSIPPEIGNLSNLLYLSISDNQLSGGIPPELGNLSNLEYFYLYNNQINGDIPLELGNLTNLKSLYLYDNQLSGSIPPQLGNLSELQDLLMYYNQLTEEIPPELGGLSNLRNLYLYGNQLSGSIPPELGNLSNLQNLSLSSNQLVGSIPPVLGNLPALEYLYLYNNNLSGSIPPELGDLSNLLYLYLSNNQLSGGIPPELGSLTELTHLQLRNNALEGDIPIAFAQLVNLNAAVTDLGYNMLTSTDQDVIAFLNSKDLDWADTQTMPPANVQVAGVQSDSVEISWQPISYSWDKGYYEVLYATNSGGPYSVRGVTDDKSSSSYVVIGLSPETKYYFTVRTYTGTHDDQQNELLSVYSPEVSTTTAPSTSPVFDITSLLPFQGRSDLPVEINIYGTGFQSGAVTSLQTAQTTTSLDSMLRINGLLSVTEIGLDTTFIGAGHLRATVPAGLDIGRYDVIVTNPDGDQIVLPSVYTTLEPEADDLFGYDFELWTNPTALREGKSAEVGLIVHRHGGTTTLSNVTVRFYLGDPDAGGILLGDGLIPVLSPNGAASTSNVSWSSPTEGEYKIYALIDPDGDVSEALESNNRIIKHFTVMGSTEDNTPPVVGTFEINNGESETTSRDVTLSVSATDPIFQGPYTGVGSVYLIEYEFNEGAATWVPVQASGWLTYTSSPLNFDWTLMPSAGVKYLQIWVADAVGNISTIPRGAVINYMLAAEDILANASRYYIYTLDVGETFSTSLTPAIGDPDLYVWSPSGETLWYSISGSGIVDEVTFVAPQAGKYVVQVYGYIDATYFLEVGVNGAVTTELYPVKLNGLLAKVPLSEPGLAPEKIPFTSIPYAVPPAPVDEFPILITGEYRVFLPLAHR